MTSIRVFEPALCCSTGVCGPETDPALITFTADLAHLQGLGVDIERHNLANDPMVFATTEPVRAFLDTVGSQGLPLTLVDGVTVAVGSYPGRDELLRLSGHTASMPEGAVELGLAAATGECCSTAGDSRAQSCCTPSGAEKASATAGACC